MRALDLSRMSLLDALTQARIMSGLSIEEVGAAMGWSPSNAARVFSTDAYWPTLPSLPKLCVTLRNTLLLDWLHAQAQAGGVTYDHEPLDCRALQDALLGMLKELGDVASEGQRAIADGTLRRDEARRIAKEMHDLMHKSFDLLSRIRALLGDGETKS